MAHCPYERLSDLEEALAEVRRWPGVKERSPGVFYLKGTPFLHFHIRGDRRWADARSGAAWGPPIEAPLDAGAAGCAAFLAKAERYYRELLAARGRRR